MYKKLNLVTLVVVLCVAFCLSASSSYATVMEEEEALAFTNFIQTIIQTMQHTRSNVTCVYGNDEITKIMVAQDKRTINLNTDPGSYANCRAIYIAKGREKGLGSDIEKYNNSKILTIAIFEGFTEMGGMLQVQVGRRNFEIILNSKTVKSSGVRLSPLVMDFVIN